MVTSRQLSAKTLRWIDTLTPAIARPDPPWHGGFSTLSSYSMITPKLETSGFFPFPAQIIIPTSPWPRHECYMSPTTTKDIYPRTQRHLTPQPKAFAKCEGSVFTTQGICLQNSRTQRHLPAKTRRDIEGFQLFTPWSHKNRLQWGFLFSHTKHSSDFTLTRHECHFVADHTAS